MKVLFVVPYPLGEAASQRFRVEQFLPFLEEEHIEYRVATFWDKKTWLLLYKPGATLQKVWGLLKGVVRRFLLVTELHKYNYIFIHREATPIGPPWFEWVTSEVFKKKLIYDLDDALWLPNTTATNTIAAMFKQHHKVAHIIRWSYKISCGNKFLQKYAATYNSNLVLIPTTVDTEHYHNQVKQQHTSRVFLGWTGSHSTVPYLKIIEPVIQRLEQEFEIGFIVIADKKPDLNIRSLIFIPWQKRTEIQDLLNLNIGVMPLPETEWAEGKCAFKAIQYMASGIPAVVSAVGANTHIVQDGVTGYTCTTEEEWYLRLRALIQDAGLRESIGTEGRKRVVQQFSVEAQKRNFLKLFT